MPDNDKPKNVACLVPDDNQDDRPGLPKWDEWHVPARDTQGHYTKFQIKMPRQLDAEARRIVDSGNYPYQSIGYFWRHAGLRLMYWLKDHPEFKCGVGSTIHAVQAMINIVREDEYNENFRIIFDRLQERVRDYISRGNDDRAKQLIIQIWAQIRNIEDDFWRVEYEKELKRKFGNLLEVKRPEKTEGDS